MRIVENAIGILLLLLAPAGLVYGWIFYLARMRKTAGWRSHVTLLSLVLTSLAVLMWPATRMLMPGVDWRNSAGVAQQVAWVCARERVALYVLVVAFVLSLFGRPRLILAIAACMGTAVLWLSSTMP